MRDEGVTREIVACDCRREYEMPIGWSVKEGRNFDMLIRKRGEPCMGYSE